ncbi:MAG: FkbM family methyltransferase [Rhizomicrobium sp.]
MNPLLKHRLRIAVGWFGLRFRETLPLHASKSEFCRHLKALGFEPEWVIDVGVADGTLDIYTNFPKARYLLVEPMSEFSGALRWISEHYRADVEPVAAGGSESTLTIHYSPQLADMHGATLAESSNSEAASNSRNVAVRRLDALAREHKIAGTILLKIDTQGTELQVLDGASGILDQVEVAILEVSLFNFGLKQPVLHEVVSYMAERGFVAYDMFDGWGRPLDGALGQVDIAFVKENGRFRRDQRYAEPSKRKSPVLRAMNWMRHILKV